MKIKRNNEEVRIEHSDEEIRMCFTDQKKLQLLIIMDTIIKAATDLLDLIMDYNKEDKNDE